jgi:hypothetical protein
MLLSFRSLSGALGSLRPGYFALSAKDNITLGRGWDLGTQSFAHNALCWEV